MFRTPYNFKDDIISCSGSMTIDINKVKKTGEKVVSNHYEYDYKEVYDKEGVRHLKVIGRHNVYDKIQSYKDDVDIYKILDKYMAGDISVLDKNKGFYIDATSIPKTFDEYQNKIVEGHKIFASLPSDFKAEFGQDINRFMHSIYDKSFESRYNEYVSRKRNNFGNISNNSVNSSSNARQESTQKMVDNGGNKDAK